MATRKRKRKRVAHNRNAPGTPATDRQGDVRAAVATLTARDGSAPSAGDVAALLGISRQGALKQLKALEAKGLVRDKPRRVTSGKWELIGTCPTCGGVPSQREGTGCWHCGEPSEMGS
jgi:hypothetical protein